MEQILPPETASGAGFDLTRVRQLTIFLENRVGRLSALLSAMEEAHQHVLAMSVSESSDAALVRVICSDPENAKPMLKDRGFSLSTTEVLVVRLPETFQCPLLKLCNTLLSAELNIHYSYPMLQSPGGPAVVIYVDDSVFAAQLLFRKGFILLSESDLKLKSDEDHRDDDPHNDN